MSDKFIIIALGIMRESQFVEQNKDKWARFEEDLRQNKTDPGILRSQLTEITDDLSYSRTFYRNRSVRIYLNGLGQQIYNRIYKNRFDLIRSVRSFYLDEVPRILFLCRRELLISFLVLLVSVGIGMFSSAKDEGFARSILGDSYVDMTLENIRKGDPMGVYKQQGQFSMFVYIAGNNLRVSLMVFVAGLLASYGSLVIMARNGIMLGVFIWFFYSRNLAHEFNLTVWLHGSMEILTLVVETVAGMLLGKGLVYPGTLSRSKAFSIWGKRGAMVFLSTVPFILMAAFTESFLTRHTDMPDLLRILLIVLTCAFMLLYFVWFPWARARRSDVYEPELPELRPDTKFAFDDKSIYSNGQIFLKSIELSGLKFQDLAGKILLITLVFLLLLAIPGEARIIRSVTAIEFDFSGQFLRKGLILFEELFSNLGILFNREGSLWMFVFSVFWVASLLWVSLSTFAGIYPSRPFKKARAAFLSLLFSAFFQIVWQISGAGILLAPVLLTLLSQIAFGMSGAQILAGFRDGLAPAAGRMSGLLFVFVLSGFTGMVLLISPFAGMAVWALEMNVEMTEDNYLLALKVLVLAAYMLICGLSICFFSIQCIFLGFTLKEISTAEGLKQSIDEVGIRKKVYGIETE